MELSIIAAVGVRNREIGLNGDLPWGRQIPSDLAHFRDLTTGHTVIMGRNTHESIIRSYGKPLPKRTSIIVSGNPEYVPPPEVMLASNLAQALSLVSEEETVAFIIGGAGLYATSLNYATRIDLTWVDYQGPADTFFPHISPTDWKEVDRQSPPRSPKDKFNFEFATYHRVTPVLSIHSIKP